MPSDSSTTGAIQADRLNSRISSLPAVVDVSLSLPQGAMGALLVQMA